jgi:hypothetical protein
MVGAVRLEYRSEARCYVGELFAVHSDAEIRTVIERIETKGERLGDMIARRSTAPRTTGSVAACAATRVFRVLLKQLRQLLVDAIFHVPLASSWTRPGDRTVARR